MRFRNWLKRIVIISLILIISGCGLPKDHKKEAESLGQQVEKLGALLKNKQADYKTFQQSSDFSAFSSYAKSEGWVAWLADAEKLADKAVTAYQEKITPLLERNKKNEAGKLITAMAEVRAGIRQAQEAAVKTEKRIAFLKKTMKEAGSMMDKAESELKAMKSRMDSTQGVLEKAKTDYPQKEQDIDERFFAIERIYSKTGSSMDDARAELDKHSKKANANYAVIADTTVLATQNLAAVTKACESLEKRVGELYRSYSKVLKDMRVDYFVTVGRTSWDNHAEYDRDNEYLYAPIKVNASTYEALAKLPENVLLATYPGRVNPVIDTAVWSSLKLNPKESMPTMDDQAQFWIEDFNAKFYHKYLMIEDGKQLETGWIEVDEDFFEDQEPNQGMALVTKPYGMYEDEALSQATPPGLAYVGNSQYGEWRQDSTGRSFWHWYGQYAFFRMMMGGGYFYRGDYDRWHRDYRGRRPYYGTGGSTYGTYSSSGRKRYSGSSYGRSGSSSRSTPSVRGSGPAGRGGGPGGRGK